jgi:hypothetical protein
MPSLEIQESKAVYAQKTLRLHGFLIVIVVDGREIVRGDCISRVEIWTILAIDQLADIDVRFLASACRAQRTLGPMDRCVCGTDHWEVAIRRPQPD